MKAFYLSCVSLLLLCAVAWGGDMSVTFDGADDYVTCGDMSPDPATDAVMIAVWFRTTTTNGGIIAAYDAQVAWYVNRAVAGVAVELNTLGNIELWCGLDRDGDPRSPRPTTTGVYNDGEWHYVFAWAGHLTSPPDRAYLYLVVDNSDVKTYLNGYPIQWNGSSTERTSFGAGWYGNTDTFGTLFDGEIFSPTIWTDVSSNDKEPYAIMGFATKNRTYPRDNLVLDLDNPAGYATGDSMDGLTFPDRSGNGNNGTGVDGANNTGLTKASTIVRKRGAKQQ